MVKKQKPIVHATADEMQKFIVQLRFGTLTPSSRFIALRSYATISRITSLSISKVRNICQNIYQQQNNEKHKNNTRNKKLNNEHLDFLCNQETLEDWASKSLDERIVLFHRQFGNIKISRTTLYNIYKQNGISQKAIRTKKHIKENKKAQYETQFVEIRQTFRMLSQQNQEILFVDECIFSYNTMMSKAYSNMYCNITINQERMSTQTYSVVAAISYDNGLVHWSIYEKSVNVDKFIDFLGGLKKKINGSQPTMFLDNLRVHHSYRVQEFMNLNKIGCLFNIPYSPDNNAIENFWSMVKQTYKKLRLHSILSTEKQCTKNLIIEALTTQKVDVIKHICYATLQKIMNG